jgi:signal transduction histidine kinase
MDPRPIASGPSAGPLVAGKRSMSAQQLHDFLEMLAQALRHPLEPVREAAEELRMTAADPQSQRIGEVIIRQVSQMTGMIDAVLDVSRLERGDLPTSLARLDLYRILESAVEDCRAALEAKSQRLIVEMPDGALEVEGDEARLVQIIRNLMSNAVRFTPEGGSIELAIEASEDEVRIHIRDSGCGISSTDLSRVFEPFALAGANNNGGLGLGLAITKRLVALHNGSITAHSEGPGQGAEFCVNLPLLRQ